MKNLFTRKFVSFLTFFMVSCTTFAQKVESKEKLAPAVVIFMDFNTETIGEIDLAKLKEKVLAEKSLEKRKKLKHDLMIYWFQIKRQNTFRT